MLNSDNRQAIFDVDIENPLDHGAFKIMCGMCDFLTDYVKGKTFLDRPISIDPIGYVGTDGPLTVAMNVRGPDILFEMIDDPEYAHKLFRFILDAAIKRRAVLIKRYNLSNGSWMADDSIALIGTEQYRDMILPHHRYWYESVGAEFGKRTIHLCGDATRHFPILKEELGVTSFDTGFPVDFAWLRKTLGPDVEIMGGVEVGTLMTGSPDDVYRRAREILTSGIMEGGRFIFREGNNLPPNVPWKNLAAMYKAVQDFGRY
jgi:uroporphyrinogen-III decarboxylase